MNNMSKTDEIIKGELPDEELIDTLIAISVVSKRLAHKLRIIKEQGGKEKNDFYELLDGIIECSEEVAKLGRLLRDFVPQFMELIPERPIEGKAVDAKAAKVLEDKKATKKAEPKAAPKDGLT